MKVVATGLLLVLCTAGMCAQTLVNVNNLKVRVERPDRVRNPEAQTGSNCYDGKDNYFNEIQIDASTFYGYTANGSKNTTIASTCRARGGQPYGMGSTQPGWFDENMYPSNAYDGTAGYGSCGLWLNGTYKSGGTWYGFAHAEGYSSAFPSQRQCTYNSATGGTTKSMALLTSADGNTWSLTGQVISNPSMHSSSNSEFGEGDCTPIPFGSYLYLYCRRTSDFQTSVARAPLTSDFSAGQWRKYDTAAGGWNPGSAWNGNDSSLGSYGSSTGLWSTKNNIMLLIPGITTGVQGIKMSFSADATTFSSVQEPILHLDGNPWPYGSSSSDEVVYPSVISPTDGSRVWGSNGYFLMSYTFAPDFDESAAASSPNPAPDHGRTLVMRDVNVTDAGTAQDPQVGVAISRWRNPDIGLRISSTQIVPYNFVTTNLAYETRTGYIMTEPPATGAVVQIDECAHRTWPSSTNPDHIFTPSTSGECVDGGSTYRKVRTAGYLYSPSSPKPANTIEVNRCKSTATGYSASTHFTSTDANCEGLGTKESLLGYGLAN